MIATNFVWEQENKNVFRTKPRTKLTFNVFEFVALESYTLLGLKNQVFDTAEYRIRYKIKLQKLSGNVRTASTCWTQLVYKAELKPSEDELNQSLKRKMSLK